MRTYTHAHMQADKRKGKRGLHHKNQVWLKGCLPRGFPWSQQILANTPNKLRSYHLVLFSLYHLIWWIWFNTTLLIHLLVDILFNTNVNSMKAEAFPSKFIIIVLMFRRVPSHWDKGSYLSNKSLNSKLYFHFITYMAISRWSLNKSSTTWFFCGCWKITLWSLKSTECN